MAAAYLLGGLESRDCRRDTCRQSACGLRGVLPVERGADVLDLIDGAGHATPGDVLEGAVALSVQPEAGVVLALDEPVPPLVVVCAPRLHGQGLVEVVFVSRLLVRVLDGL